MAFKGRTVLAFILLSMFASSILTLTIVKSPAFSQEISGSAGAPSGTAGSKAGAGLSDADVKKISKTFDLIQKNYVSEVEHDKVVNGAINGMLAVLDDPYTSYMDQKEAKQFDESISSSFEGVGAEVSMVDGKVTIMSPIKGSPAEKAGLRTGDVIVTVNSEKLDGLTLNQAVMKIRGQKGTQAKLGVVRSGAAEPIEVIVVRDAISVETVYAEMMSDGIGKIEIRQFSLNTGTRFKEELEKLENQGMKGLVIDVRNDPGGLLDVVLDIVQPFVEKGKPLIQVENKIGQKDTKVSENPNPPKKYPVAVLINNGSASASEILAGVFKEVVPGSKIIGETSYGKGTVQVTFSKEMGDGSNIKMTVYKWLTPNGNWINKKGVEPDMKVEQPAIYTVAPFSRKTTLKFDTTGEDVKTLQTMLAALGFPADRTDGYFSDKTMRAVKSFQQQHGLTATGEVDEKTMDKLEQETIAFIKEGKHDLQLSAAVKHMQDKLSGK
ncbi:S41 family peptidase [Paenibacillus contaminans]|uniref:Peptidase S41 n=1 Tax=Paenibacillus contaminans TaxID=450362 RepID=A0A329MBS2_9BACL|nr:S41 family peptidase [Paenibacillus contaminans]RAV17431.1 peptidase S41 [Paenibacillus contaminans]